MTRNEKAFLKTLEKAQRSAKRELKTLDKFTAAHPNAIRADKLRKMRLQAIYSQIILREVINTFHREIVLPREDRYVHVNVVRRLRLRIATLEALVQESEIVLL